MRVPRTYRLRLVSYSAVLLAFLVGVLVLSYRASSELVLREAETNLARMTQQLAGQIRIEGADLLERAKMVRDSASFQEYLFIAISLGTDPRALRDQYQRHFGWLQIDRTAIMARDGRVLLGGEHRDLINALAEREVTGSGGEKLLYLDSHQALEMVAVAPVYYRSQHLGFVAVTKSLGAHWMNNVRHMTGGELLLVKRGTVVASTFGARLGARDIPAGTERLVIDADTYLVKHVPLGGGLQVCELWFALSQAELTARLAEQRNIMLGLTAAGGIAILLVGLWVLRNFSAPVSRLVTDIQAVSEGRFPELRKTESHDEIGFLTNHFADMVASLREKQEEIRRVHTQLEQQATTDALTGFYNRRYLYDLYPKLWSEALRAEKHLAVALIDLDLFKQVNDEHGHLTGDEVLRHFARVLRSCSRVSDFLFRIGGEEFLVLTSGDTEGAQILAEKIRASMEAAPLFLDGKTLRVTVSIGVAQAEAEDGVSGLSAVLTRADHALYAAKQAGRNRVAVYQERFRRRA